MRENLNTALTSRDPEVVFDVLIRNPLGQLPRPEKAPMVLIIDALDEIPKQGNYKKIFRTSTLQITHISCKYWGLCPLKQFRPSMRILFRDDCAHLYYLSAAGKKPLLDLICKQLLGSLPPWMRLFTTSRDEPLICQSLNKFQPIELRADEEKNRKDVDMYLRKIAGLLIAPTR